MIKIKKVLCVIKGEKKNTKTLCMYRETKCNVQLPHSTLTSVKMIHHGELCGGIDPVNGLHAVVGMQVTYKAKKAYRTR
jgi:hypothetical protein